ncbi:hypothetical protein [Candidatus Synchoanobacter obligatus]|uniref:Uncharacterized protein n=1 Tax=Candidatus Synchoanobacter obligatus TaxID=2919597 RepID=A0ABT1L400_9GAMM|nr:hypothetical protein [Candidatus Synchoanobacter obligatus]MCP8351914.1 hypothetical protein [Candidatus Synchoanobacter obligatus]
MQALDQKSQQSSPYISSFALALAITVGFGLTGGISLTASYLKPILTVLPEPMFNLLLNIVLCANIALWTGIQFTGMKGLFSYIQASPKDKYDKRMDTIKSYYPQHEADWATIEHLVQARIRDEQKVSLKNLDLVQEQISKDSAWVSQWWALGGLYKDYLYSMANTGQLITRNSYLNAIIQPGETISTSSPVNEDLKEIVNLAYQAIELDCPQWQFKAERALHNTIKSVVYPMTLINAFMINNIGFIMFGAMSFIQVMGLSNPILMWTAVGYFGLVGSLSALSFSGPSILGAIDTLFGYNAQAQKSLSDLRKLSKSSGFFPLPSYAQKALAIFMGAGIAVGNFMANIAFGEVLFAGKSLFDATLMTSVFSAPFSASTPSIILGVVGGITTWALMSIMFIAGTLTINLPNPSDTKESESSTVRSLFERGAAICLAAFSLASGAALYLGRSIGPFLRAHIAPLMLISLSIVGILGCYQRCSDDENTLLTNMIVSISMISTTFVSYYLNVLPSSIYFQVLPKSLGYLAAATTSVANLELSLPIFKSGCHTLNNATPKLLPESTSLKDSSRSFGEMIRNMIPGV